MSRRLLPPKRLASQKIATTAPERIAMNAAIVIVPVIDADAETAAETVVETEMPTATMR